MNAADKQLEADYSALSPSHKEVLVGAAKLLLKQQNNPASVTAEDWAFLDKLKDPAERAKCVSILRGEDNAFSD